MKLYFYVVFPTRRYKYTVLADHNGARPWQLFDLEQDPQEMHNLLDDPDAEEVLGQHERWMRERMEEVGDDFPPLRIDTQMKNKYLFHKADID